MTCNLIALTGTNGAGKGTVSEYLLEKHEYTAFSTRDFIIKEILRCGLEVNRDSMKLVGDDIRMTHESGYMTRMLLGEFLEGDKGNAVIESIRSLDATEFLLAHDAHLWAIDAPQDIRYQRVMDRRSETDHVTFEEFVQHEKNEYKNENPREMSVLDVMSRAELTIQNAGTKEELFQKIEEALYGK